MKTMSKALLVICLTGLVLGLSNVGPPNFSGLARAIGAIFFILTYVSRVAELVSAEEGRGETVSSTEADHHHPVAGYATAH